MKKTYIMMAAAGLVAVAAVAPLCFSQANEGAPAAAPAAPVTAPATADQAKTAFSYYAGYSFAQQIANGTTTLTTEDFDRDVFFKAVADSLAGEGPAMSEEEISAGMRAFVATVQERENAVAAQNLEKGHAFEAEFAKQEGVTKTESGLMYRVLTKGEGRAYNEKEDGADAIAMVTYEGKKIDGKTFDKAEQPIPMPISQVVPGFSEALKLMPVGSEWEICIPAALGYGEQAPGPIGANSTLIFTVKLHDISKNEAPQGGMPMQLTPEMIQQLQAQGLDVVDDGTGNPAPAPAKDAE